MQYFGYSVNIIFVIVALLLFQRIFLFHVQFVNGMNTSYVQIRNDIYIYIHIYTHTPVYENKIISLTNIHFLVVGVLVFFPVFLQVTKILVTVQVTTIKFSVQKWYLCCARVP